ncbi:oxidoreductase, partial [Inquilinus limosus MP06]
NAAHARIPVGPGYQVPLAREIREKSGLTTRAVGMIVDPHQAEGIIARGDADQVALARAVLDDPRWGWHAAEALGAELTLPAQYARAGARTWPGRKLLQAAE